MFSGFPGSAEGEAGSGEALGKRTKELSGVWVKELVPLLVYSFWFWIQWLVVCESTIFQTSFITKRLLWEAGRKNPAVSGTLTPAQRWSHGPSGARVQPTLLQTAPVDVHLPALAASSSPHPSLLLTTVLEQLPRYRKSLASSSSKLIWH